jgi:hypothetical protein
MSEKYVELEIPPGEAAPEVLEERLWIDGCWDFFHHGRLFDEMFCETEGC